MRFLEKTPAYLIKLGYPSTRVVVVIPEFAGGGVEYEYPTHIERKEGK